MALDCSQSAIAEVVSELDSLASGIGWCMLKVRPSSRNTDNLGREEELMTIACDDEVIAFEEFIIWVVAEVCCEEKVFVALFAGELVHSNLVWMTH
uniref:Uncharacterized protein n=1 Tax=Parascaris equorum TaxID=6256 RepID=A0A914RSP7_PAREQ